MQHQKRITACLLAALLLCALLSGCSPKTTGPAWDVTDASPEYLTRWPDNAFTGKIPEPQSGTIDYVLDSSASGRYAIFIKDISAEACSRYIEALQDIGYSKTHAAGHAVSVGTLLERDDASVSVSYAEGILGILVTIKE